MMDDILENRLSMYQKVQYYLNLHEDETAAIPMVATLQGELDDKVDSALALAAIVDTDITGYTVDKQNKRNDLTAKIFKLSTALVAYARSNNNSILAEKCDETLTGMGYMRDNDFYAFSKIITNAATPVMTSLVPFGIVPADLPAATATAEIYFNNIQSPRGQINERSKALQDLTAMMKSTDDLVKDRLDAVMGIYEATNISLYNGYRGARSIDGTGSQTPADYEGEVGTGKLLIVANIPYLGSRRFQVQNTGTVPLTFSLSTEKEALNGTPVLINPGILIMRKSTNLNESEMASNVLLLNADLNVSGNYKIWVIE